MRENRHAKFRRDFECRTRLRRIQQKVAARALDQKAAQAQLTNGALGLARRPVAVIAIDRRQAVNAARISRHQRCEIVVHGHDGFVRHAAIRIGDQLDQNADDARVQMTVADVLQQQTSFANMPASASQRARCVGGAVRAAVTSKRAGTWWQ